MRERFNISRILSVFAMVALMAVPSIGYTMQYDRGFVDGQAKVSQLQTKISILSARMGEMEADLYQDDIALSLELNSLEPSGELSMATAQEYKPQTSDCMATCYKQPEVGWRYVF